MRLHVSLKHRFAAQPRLRQAAVVRRAFVIAILTALAAQGWQWPQFRGPNAGGVSTETNLPVEFGPDRNIIWRTAVPRGNSSPVIAGGRIFLTAHEGDKLLTLALDRESGKILWRREAPRPRVQEIEREANGPASASPVTDGRNVYVFFADFGLLAYGPDGNELWRMPLGPFNNPFGHGSSPVLAGDTLLMACDQDVDSFLIAVEKNSGKVRWRAARPYAQRGYSTPVVYEPPGGGVQAILAGSYRMSAYDLGTGQEVWWVRELPWQVKPTPVLGDHSIYFVTYSGESDPGQQEVIPTFDQALNTLDADKDGKLSKAEIVDPRAKARFEEYLDLDDSGFLEKRDWEQFQLRRAGENGLRAYRLGKQGDLTQSEFLWKNSRSLPNVPSPLYYRGVLYTLKEGGIFTSYDIKTGEIVKQGRLQGALGTYFASPIAVDGRIYVISEDGKAAVIQAGAQWEVIRVNDLGDGSRSTPAVADSKMYVRTFGSLYCFARR
jgi:outer membrane protein assembly factor BamB